MDDGAIWLVIGVQAAGKSTIAELLAGTFERGVHVRGGQFYRWATHGWVHAGTASREQEARAHLDLRYRLSSPDHSLAPCEPGYPARGRSLAGEFLRSLRSLRHRFRRASFPVVG